MDKIMVSAGSLYPYQKASPYGLRGARATGNGSR
jgi:hypothetical protein